MPLLVALKRLIDPQRPITYGIVQAGEDIEGGVPYIRPVDMKSFARDLDPATLRTTSSAIASRYKRSTVRAGDLVVSIGPSFGKTLIVPPRLAGANLTQGTARLAPNKETEVRFLQWALASASAHAYWEAAVGGATFGGLNLGPLSQTPVPLLTHHHQSAIADFLDRECARIAELTERTNAQEEGLHSYPAAVREAALAHLPGEIRLGRVAAIMGGAGFPHHHQGEISGDFPFVKASDLQASADGQSVADAANWVSEATRRELRARVVPEGAIVFPKVGAAMLKNTRRLARRPLLMDNNLAAVVPREQVASDFLFECLSRVDLGQWANPGPVPSIGESEIRALRVPWGSAEERAAVVRQVQAALSSVRPLGMRLQERRRLLADYRESLITEAVTGQLDVTRAGETEMDERLHAAAEAAA